MVAFGSQQLSGQLWRVVGGYGPQLPADERGAKLLGSREALKQVAQFVLLFGLGALLLSQPMLAPGQIRAVYGTFGVIYALQVRL